MKNKVLVALATGLLALGLDAKVITFSNGIPEGWSKSGALSAQKDSCEGVSCLRVDTRNQSGSCILKSSVFLDASDLPTCDNICVKVAVYNQSRAKDDKIRLFGTLDGFKTTFSIGEPFSVYDAAKGPGWITTRYYSAYVPGLTGAKTLALGLEVVGAGFGGQYTYVESLEFVFRASATPTEVGLCDELGNAFSESNPLVPGSRPFLSCDVAPIPSGITQVDSVSIVVDRNGQIQTNELSFTTGNRWVSPVPIDFVDAGETIRLHAISTYHTDGSLDPLDDGGVCETEWTDPVVCTKLGSIWINEFSGTQIELCGTTNRVPTDGWCLRLVDGGKTVKDEKTLGQIEWSSVTNNGVRFAVYDWSPVCSESDYLQLVNAGGQVESEVSALPMFGMTGVIAYNASWDWTGASSQLSWGRQAQSSIGFLNAGEGFEIPFSTSLKIGTYSVQEISPEETATNWFPFATTICNAYFSSGVFSKSLPTAASGFTDVFVIGQPHTNESVLAEISALAFGWCSDPLAIGLKNGEEEEIGVELSPSTGEDSFASEIKAYWNNSGWSKGDGCVQTDMRSAGANTKRTLKVKNGISAHDKGYASLSVSVFSENKSGNIDRLVAEIKSKDGTADLEFPEIVNKNSVKSEWKVVNSILKLNDQLSQANDNEFSLVGIAGGFSGSYLKVKDLRLAFQDSVEASELAVKTNAVSEGQTAVAFSAVVSPLATEAGVKDVSVDFMLKVKDGTKVMDFAVPCDWSNAVTVAGGVAYEGSGQTNTLVEAMRFTATTNDVSTALAAAGGGKYFGTGATIEYYVCAHYYADSNDPDKSKEWEERYYPDNHQVDDKGAWYVIGDYKPVATNMTITGPGLSFRSDPTVRSDGFTFDFRAFSSAGDIVSNGVTVAGVTTTFVAVGKTKVLDSTFTLDGGLTANTSYTVTLIYWTENGQMVSRDMEITTLGTAAAPTLVDRAADSLTVKADGCKAVAMAIACNGSTQWIAYGESATFNGLEPDCEYEVTVVAVRNLAGVETETAAAAKFYTLPNNPTANVTETPGWGSHTISVTNLTNDAFGAFGNPSNTVYAFYVESVNNEGVVVATNWLGETTGGIEEIDEAMPKWLTLAEWDNKAFRLSLTTTETNNLYLIAGGREPIPDGHEAANGFELTKPSPKRLVKISLFAETVGEAERVAYDPAQHEATYGLVSLTNRVMSPFADGVKDATVAYEYTTDDGATWNEMTLRTAGSIMAGGSDPKISGNEIKDVLSDDCVSNIVTVTWDSAKDLAADSVYNVAIRATLKDGVHTAVIADVSLKGGELDFVKPTVELTSKTHRSPFSAAPLKVDVTFNEDVVGFTKNSVKVGNGTVTAVVTNSASSYTVEIAPAGQGARVLDISVWVEAGAVTDVYGNRNVASKEPKPMWTYDTVPPTVSLTSGTHDPFNEKGSPFVVTAEFSEPVVGLLKDWVSASNFSKLEIVTNSPSNYTIKVTPAEDGDVTVTIAKGAVADLAGNPNVDAESLTHVYDTTPPVLGDIVGWPMTPWTNTTEFSFTISATDKSHPITYEWTTNNDIVVSTATNFTGNVPGEGVHVLFVSATDAAGNVSEESRMVFWGVDLKEPTDPVIDAESSWPKVGAKTNDRTFSFTATSEDMLAVSFYWQIDNGPLVKKAAKEPFTGTFSDDGTDDGEHTVSVYAVDMASNRSKGTTTQSWTLDTTAPVLDEITGTPAEGAVTNGVEYSFSIALKKEDLTDVTFHWLTNGVWAADVANFSDKVAGKIAAEGKYVASVYGTDAAGNVSVTNSRTWMVDWTAPKMPDIDGEPTNGSITNLTWFKLSATVTDNLTTPTFRWSFDGGEVQSLATNMPFASSGMQDGDHTVLCYAVDEAFNVSETNFWRWTVDTTVPTNFVLVGTPGDGDVTTSTNFDFKASAMDSTKLTYHWTLTGKEWGNTSSNYAGVVSEGTNWVSVFARDEVGNVCDPTGRTWVVDYTPPTLWEIEDKPTKLTNKPEFKMIAKATDTWTQMTYHWTFNDKSCDDVTGATFSSQVHPAVEGTNTVSVFVTDEAKNVSATNSYEWVLDTTPPTVTLESKTQSPFNTAMAPMVVTVKFNESVPDFSDKSVVLENGQDLKVETVVPNREYKLSINPFGFGERGVWTNVTVRIMKGAVHDDAGNENEKTVSMTKTYDTRCPIVTLSADDTPDFFNTSPMKVKVEFSEEKVDYACVYGFTRDSVVVTNCEVTAIEETKTNNTYVLTVRPLADGPVTVVVPDDVVTNRIGNYNAASQPLTKTYDATEPQDLTILGTPTNKSVTAVEKYEFKASAKDLTELKFTWQLNDNPPVKGVSSNEVFKGDAPKGTNTVTVFAVDQAGNQCATVTNTWIYDYLPPTMPTLSGGPGMTNKVVVTTDLDFDYVAHAVDDYTRVTYHWLTNGVVVAENPTNFVGSVAEGTNTVEVYATDEADNISGTNAVVWVVDRTPPTLLGWSGLPEKFTTATDLSLTATASDNLTRVTYHWTFDTDKEEQTKDGEAFVRNDLADGEHTVKVYATDEADNVSTTTNSWTWTVDTHAPTNLVVVGEPADGSVTSNRVFRFEVSSEDLTDVSYSWKLDDGQTSDKQNFSGKVMGADGTYSVSVIATDLAGNASSTNWTWTLDTTAPTNLTVRGLPIADDPKTINATNGCDFALVASADDATALKYYWATNGVEATDCTASNFVGKVSEGTNTVTVYAMDEGSNVCEAIERKWVVDQHAPTILEWTGKPDEITKETGFRMSAKAQDNLTGITFHWKLDTDADETLLAEGEKFVREELDDGSHTVTLYATDEAHNASERLTWTWTVDTIAPEMPVIVYAFPASNSFVNVTNYNFRAAEPEGEEDATAVTFLWRIEGGDLDGKKENPVTNFTGEVGKDGAYTAFVYAKDAAGNISTTNNLSWTVDTQIPTNLVISGWPANGSLTNGPNYCLTATADDATTLTFHWTISDAAGVSDLSKDKPFEGKVADGPHAVSCYATDAAGNVSTNKFWSWTSDTTGPTNLVLSVGTPSEGAVVATNGYDFTASAMDLTGIEYSWVLNGETSKNTMSNLVGTAAIEGTNTLSVTATDAAGNPSEETLTRTWVVDTFAPTNLVVTGTPGDGVLTNETSFSWTVSAKDATQITYHWLTNGVEVVDETATNNFVGTAFEGTNVVGVFATDEANNVSETNTVRWMVDTIAPTVALSTETSEDHVINRADVFKVKVAFSEAVAGFTKESVTVSNGTVTNVAASAKTENAYDVWIAPAADGDITVQIEANKVKDLAGNGNVASEPLTRTCDITPPSVSLEGNMPDPIGPSRLIGTNFMVTVTFSELVTNFTASSVTVSNCTVKSVSPLTGAAKTYTVVIEPPDHDDVIAISIAGGAVTDLAGNGNTASDVLTRKYDRTRPTTPVITGTPASNSTTRVATYNLVARSEDFTDLTYYWSFNGGKFERGTTNFTGVVDQEGTYTVRVQTKDSAGNPPSEVASWSWTYKKGETPDGVSFGDSVQLKITDVSVTNVEFTAVDFQPGEESTFSLREFELKGSQATKADITDLKMWFIVGTNMLDDTRWDVKVDENADFDAGTLTVTIPGKKTTDQNTGKPFETFFIFGIDNKGSDE